MFPIQDSVPRTMSGGTLLALAADQIVMSEYAVLGLVNPQLGEYPAASILKAAHLKPIAEVEDKTLILADQAEKAIAQMRQEVTELIADKYAGEKAKEIAKLMTSGTWTHDYPITCERAHALGLPVNTGPPENVLRLMQLYPQPMRRQPSVEYVPLPYRAKRPAGPQP
jgi:ClpP class serine protease